MTAHAEKKRGLNLDFVAELLKEKRSGQGEDYLYYNVNESVCIFAAFDGCGGSGAESYEALGGRTGAYIASRTAALALDSLIRDKAVPDFSSVAADFKSRVLEYLSGFARLGAHEMLIKSKLSKSFPTTCAVCMLKGSGLLCIWAGDSRCYILSSKGLMQLSEDDLGGIDPMENLSADARIRNVISLSGDFTLHNRYIEPDGPFFVFAASDGCFDYLDSPMAFELLLLEAVNEAETAEQLEQNISARLSHAGDDVCLCGGAFGYGSFEGFKKSLEARRIYLEKNFVGGPEGLPLQRRRELWDIYKKDYLPGDTFFRQWDTGCDSAQALISCSSCGYVMSADARYCSRCGQKLGDISEKKPCRASVLSSPQEGSPESNRTDLTEARTYFTRPDKKG